MSTQVESRVNQILEVNTGMEKAKIGSKSQAILLQNPPIYRRKKLVYLS